MNVNFKWIDNTPYDVWQKEEFTEFKFGSTQQQITQELCLAAFWENDDTNNK